MVFPCDNIIAKKVLRWKSDFVPATKIAEHYNIPIELLKKELFLHSENAEIAPLGLIRFFESNKEYCPEPIIIEIKKNSI